MVSLCTERFQKERKNSAMESPDPWIGLFMEDQSSISVNISYRGNDGTTAVLLEDV